MKIYKLVFSPIDVNTYILEDPSGDCAIIDCGCYTKNESEELAGLIESHKLNPVLLLNTHCHLDHVFGNSFILGKYNLRTLCNKEEELNRERSVQDASLFGLSMKTPPEPDRYLTDGEEVVFGTTRLQVLNVPGHTAGSVAFYNEKEGVVFTGDALFSGTIGRTDLPGGSFETLINSIKNKLFTLPGSTIVYPGHGGETSIEAEINSNPYFNN